MEFGVFVQGHVPRRRVAADADFEHHALMGHSSINTTLNVYGGLFPRLEEAIADGLDELFAAAAGGET